ncbi:MAG: hypothetical protein U5L96_08005 [Owenweeksia sp.]|nr:hypothetical protein [Owenweeksia sp.]
MADDAALTANAVDVALTETTINGTLSYVCTHDFDGSKYFSIIQKGFIIWTGSEWRGGLSALTNHAPSDEPGDVSKSLYI